MFKSGFTIESVEQFKAAMFNKTAVTVWQNGVIIDYGGPIEKHTEHAVFINSGYFLKENFVFKIR